MHTRDALHMGPLFPVIPSIFFFDTFFYLVKKSIPRHFQDDRQCLSLPGYFVPPRSYSGYVDTWIKPDINVDELDHKNYKQGCPGGPKKVSTSFFEWGIFVYSIFLVRWRWRVFLRVGIYCMYLRNIITCLLRIKNVKNWCNLKTTFYDLQFETLRSLLAQKLKKLW